MKITLTLLLLALPVSAQTRTEFRRKYESPKADTYLVRQGIIMSVKFAAAPLWKNYACEAIVKPENTTASKPDVPEVMAAESVEQIIDEVIPVEERGRLVNQMSVNGGCTGLRISIYENVTISRATRCKQRGGGTYQAWIRWKAIWCEDNK
ncbi:MAG TPA: hypothetical protein VF525_00395 [Pyrinomonadaceae bacterium]|jgi:hypothetical protein